tara:strand:- start:545 stop:949 length:405 start_codon:yes stop_codon:yes gene_type:complete
VNEANNQQQNAYDRGAEKLQEVYAGTVEAIPEGVIPFNDVMVRTLFAEVWTRDVLSMRDRRLLLMGVIATYGTVDIWNLQARAALQNGELDANELRETLVLLASYAGYPNVAGLVGETESVIAAWESEQQATND